MPTCFETVIVFLTSIVNILISAKVHSAIDVFNVELQYVFYHLCTHTETR